MKNVMSFKYHKHTHSLFLAFAITSFVAGLALIFEYVNPAFPEPNTVLLLLPVLFCFIEGSSLLHFYFNYKKKNGRKMCKHYAIYDLISLPIYMILMIVVNIIWPFTYTYNVPLYFTFILVYIILIVERIALANHLGQHIRNGEGGYVALKNHSIIAAGVFLAFLSPYLLAPIKLSNLGLFPNVDLTSQETMIAILASDQFLITTMIAFVFVILLMLVTLFMSISTLFSYKENVPIDFRGNFDVSKRIFVKYHVGFWFGILVSVMLLIPAIVNQVISLASLYLAIILVRLPMHFWTLRLEKRYANEPYKLFVKKHHIMIYAGICLLIFSFIVFLFGIPSNYKAGKTVGAILLFIYFIPWAGFKIYSGIHHRRMADKTDDPTKLIDSFLDILIAIFTLSNTIFIISGFLYPLNSMSDLETIENTPQGTIAAILLIVGLVVSFCILIYSVVVSVKLLVLGSRGLQHKRVQKYVDFHPENSDVLAEIGQKQKN